ncbi:MAG: long-chain fatty acid--CoA ligase [Dehalococcoidia bacterium]
MTAYNPASVLSHHAVRFPDRPCVLWEDETISWGAMDERAGRIAGGLQSLGIGKGDIVALLLHNCPEFIELIWAIGWVGAVFMPINWRLAGDEVAYIVGHAGAKLVVSERELEALAEAARPAAPQARFVSIDGDSAGWIPYATLRSATPPPIAEVAADDLHRLMYTSGTTARPKGVMISYGNLYWKNIAHVVEFGVTADDLGLACGPLYHVGALDLTTTTLLYAGAPVVVQRKFDAGAVIAAFEERRVTTVWLAPAMINQILAHPALGSADLTSVRLIIDGGEKMPLPLIERLTAAFPNAWFCDAYGLTETVSGDTFLDKQMTVEKIGSVGRPCLHLDVAIWDDDGRALPAGETGEIVLRGPKVFGGYWRDPAATAAAFAGGWFHTGDVGLIDEDGFLYIVDRKKDMIVSGGENIASPEIERVLYEHPAVLEAAVIGKPDDRWGEVPLAFVVLREGQDASGDDLVQFCFAKLARYKAPRDIRFVEALPRTPSGKVLKRLLREQLGGSI